MPYQGGSRLPGENSSKIAHLEVLKSPLVKRLVESFEKAPIDEEKSDRGWIPIPKNGTKIKYIYGVDGSVQSINSSISPYSRIAYVKTAIIRIDTFALSRLDKENPHPLILQDIIDKSVACHTTAFPLQNVKITGMSNYDAIRGILFESLKDDAAGMEGKILDTLKWLVFEKWGPNREYLPKFQCPHCLEEVATLPFDAESGNCPGCGKNILITDLFGFHIVMGEDTAPDAIATDYMTIHETLLLLTAIRLVWEDKTKDISKFLFVKDGPLSIRAQYSKLIVPIRNFIEHAKNSGHPIHIIGQEKSGAFFDHLQYIVKDAPEGSMLILQDEYIKSEIQHRPLNGAFYGKDTNFGAKVLLKLNNYHNMVLNIPVRKFKPNPTQEDLIGIEDILATIPEIISYRHEGGLIPIELAHGIVSLSTYPSAHILQLFTEQHQS